MMAQPQKPKMSNDLPNFPKRPIKNYIPFESPNPKCAIDYCISFSTPNCELCHYHCEKIHKNNHTQRSKEEIDDLIAKYLGDKK